SLNDLLSPVRGISKQRVSQILHMGAYLMGAPGFKTAFHERNVAKILQHTVVRHRCPSLIALGKCHCDTPVARTPSEIDGYRPFRRIRNTPDQCEVATRYRMLEKLPGQVRHRPLGLSNNKQPRRILVDAMYQPGAAFIVGHFRQSTEMKGQRVHKRS